jgi:tetratricopeptide (TPR) repeat protein
LSPEVLVRLYYWLSEALYWLSRFDDYLQLGEEGLELVEPGSESVEAALVNHILSVGYLFAKGDQSKYSELRYRNAKFIQNLPYDEVLAPAYLVISDLYKAEGEVGEALKWLRILEEKAKSQGDFRAVGLVLHWTAGIMRVTGDLHSALLEEQKSLEIFSRIGDRKHMCWSQGVMEMVYIDLGDLRSAEVFSQKSLENAKVLQSKRDIAISLCDLGIISLCQGAHEKTIEVFRDAVQLHKDTGNSSGEYFATYLLGRAYQASGNRAAALEQFQTCLALRGAQAFTETGTLGMDLCTLNGIEDVSDDAQWFRTYCRRFLEAHPKINETPFVQWYLERISLVSRWRS